MKVEFADAEKKLFEYAVKKVVEYNTLRHEKGFIDTLYSFIQTEDGNFYDGGVFEPNIAQATVCGERVAMSNMTMREGNNAKIKSIVVLDPVPNVQSRSTPPCGTCRHLIWQFSTPGTSVILGQYIQQNEGGKLSWNFPVESLEKYVIAELYPHPYEPNPNLWK